MNPLNSIENKESKSSQFFLKTCFEVYKSLVFKLFVIIDNIYYTKKVLRNNKERDVLSFLRKFGWRQSNSLHNKGNFYHCRGLTHSVCFW